MGQKAGSRTPLSKKATALPYYCEDGLFLLWKVFWQMRDDERTPIRAALFLRLGGSLPRPLDKDHQGQKQGQAHGEATQVLERIDDL